MKIEIKPLSVNKAWKGKRFKTDDYKKYERDVLLLLKPMKIPEGELSLFLKLGLSSPLCDFDNPVKPFVDCLQKKYGFNDNRIKTALILVDNVAVGDEYIEFYINPEWPNLTGQLPFYRE